MPLDYSKWKKIEVSDDEDDTHPNIHTPSLFKWRHQSRLERMAEAKEQKEKLSEQKASAEKRVQDIEEKLKSPDLEGKERMKLELERSELKKQEEEFLKKEKELEDKEKLEPWNVDTIGHEAFSSSRINKISGERPTVPRLTEEEENKRMASFFKDNDDLLKTFGRLNDLEASEKFLLEHPHLVSDFSATFLTIEALNFAMQLKDDEMGIMAEQCILIQYMLQLSNTLHALATNTSVIKNFFKKFRSADPTYMALFHEEVESFKNRLRKRGKEKRDAAISEEEADSKAKRIAASPGGLDPQEVFDTLPEEMREAFASQEIARLKAAAEKMDQEVFTYHLQRCIDSGLWIPDANVANKNSSEVVKTE
ncbi:putative Hsp90 co-chaperone cdc37 [Toxocara canis]|uniref:Hsp90 chaperone protein kinase-targeting subunit n=1 Tax=Toxocara canis TaxID=6265 RepID=A0A0B2VS16_TOXCA|nr:putative Hsp90 co-chaperone cdc37 [Toxocara canis]